MNRPYSDYQLSHFQASQINKLQKRGESLAAFPKLIRMNVEKLLYFLNRGQSPQLFMVAGFY